MDKLGRVVPSDISDPWCARCGIALALGELSPTLSEEEVKFRDGETECKMATSSRLCDNIN